MSLWQGKRQEARGKSEEVLGDFTFLYIPLNFYVHLLILRISYRYARIVEVATIIKSKLYANFYCFT